MRFSGFKIFRSGSTIDEVIQYLGVDLANSLRDLATGINKLKLTENFEGFQATFEFSGIEEKAFRHNVGFIPSQRIIVRASSPDICDGVTPWSRDFVYMRKTGAGAGSATILFLR